MAKARICWNPDSQADRRNYPVGHRYIAPARFEEEYDKFDKEAWSLVVTVESSTLAFPCTAARVEFLVPEAPSHLLHVGSRFELFEGRPVATGEVIA
jgi:hypothetical protein